MKLKGLLGLFSFCLLIVFTSCTKINESTELGDELIPSVDNVNTFDTTLEIQSAYFPFNDTTRHLLTENLALGKLNDPVFGTTNADMYFNLSSGVSGQGYGTYPFGGNKDSIQGIDSVVLSLSYQGGYGDTANSQINVEVYEISSGSTFKDDSVYRYDNPAFAVSGGILGTKSFVPKTLRDSLPVIRKGDTSKVANVLRVRLNNSLAAKLSSFDTSNGYKSDSAFRSLFRGLAVKTTTLSGQGALAYFSLNDLSKSQLIIYYRKKNGTVDSAASVVFTHARYGQANSILRSPAGDYLANLNNPSTQNFYIQSSPAGSYVGIKIPGLSTFPNKIIHRAELIAYKVPSSADNIFTAPSRLLLDRVYRTATTDTAFTFESDLQVGLDGSLNLASFGGDLRSDNSYRFNVTRYVQGIVTRKERNDSLRLYAPLRSTLYAKNLAQNVSIPNLVNIASGRVVIASPALVNGNNRLRLRIIYSNL